MKGGASEWHLLEKQLEQVGPVRDVLGQILVELVVADDDVLTGDRAQVHEGGGASAEPGTHDRHALSVARHPSERMELDAEERNLEPHADERAEGCSVDRPQGELAHAWESAVDPESWVEVLHLVAGYGVPQLGHAAVGAYDLEHCSCEQQDDGDLEAQAPVHIHADQHHDQQAHGFEHGIHVAVEELHGLLRG